MASLTVNGLVFSGEATSPFGFHFTELTDWYSLPDSKSEVEERPQAHGAFGIANDYRQSLAISFKGWYRSDAAWPQSRADIRAAKRAFRTALGANHPVLGTFVDDDESTNRYLSIRSAPVDDDHGRPYFTFEVDMIAPDPLAYGDTVTVDAGPAASGGGLTWPLGTAPSGKWEDWGADGSSGRVTVHNDGTAAGWPTLRVRGGTSAGFVVTDQTLGRTVEFDRQIPDGSVVTVNQRTQTASIDGASNDVSGFLRGDFFAIPPGESHVIAWAPLGVVSGSPRLFVDFSPPY
jgi:hypothetical protein